MPDIEFQYVLLAALAIALVVAAVTDIRRRQIDNWLNVVILGPAACSIADAFSANGPTNGGG